MIAPFHFLGCLLTHLLDSVAQFHISHAERQSLRLVQVRICIKSMSREWARNSLQRTAASHRCCNPRVPWAGSLLVR